MYEYHVTVRDGDISKFKDWCCMNQVKPLLIDLHRVEGAGNNFSLLIVLVISMTKLLRN